LFSSFTQENNLIENEYFENHWNTHTYRRYLRVNYSDMQGRNKTNESYLKLDHKEGIARTQASSVASQ